MLGSGRRVFAASKHTPLTWINAGDGSSRAGFSGPGDPMVCFGSLHDAKFLLEILAREVLKGSKIDFVVQQSGPYTRKVLAKLANF